MIRRKIAAIIYRIIQLVFAANIVDCQLTKNQTFFVQCTQWSQGGSKVNKRKLKFVLLIESIPLFDYLRHRIYN